jgi:hypothetical protein
MMCVSVRWKKYEKKAIGFRVAMGAISLEKQQKVKLYIATSVYRLNNRWLLVNHR